MMPMKRGPRFVYNCTRRDGGWFIEMGIFISEREIGIHSGVFASNA